MVNVISIAATALVVFLGHGSAVATARNLELQSRLMEREWTINLLPQGPEKPDPKVTRRDVSTGDVRPAACPTIATVRGGSVILKGPWAPWGVQVAGNFSVERALASFDALQRRYPSIVVGPPLVMCSIDRSHGQVPLFQIRLPAPDQEHAFNLCSRLEAVGGACVVLRNEREALANS